MQWLPLIFLIPYIYMILKIFSGLKKLKPFKPQQTDDVFVSVIVACRNEVNNITSLLSDIAAQNFSQDQFELIIVDDNSTDSTYSVVSAFNKIKNLKVVRNSGTGKKRAVKSGVELCSGELIVLTDADCSAGKNWLGTIVSFYSENRPAMIICPVMLKGSKGFLQRFQELEFLSLQGVTAGTAVNRDPVMCNGANLAFTKEAYQAHSGNLHDEKVSGDDVFLLHNFKREKSNKILWLESENAIITTSAAENLSAFINQRARWISKAGSYTDSYTVLLAIVTFVTILLLPLLLIAAIFDQIFLIVFFAVIALKSIPDYFILRNTASRYGKSGLMKWFIPSQLFYTFYILWIIPRAIHRRNNW